MNIEKIDLTIPQRRLMEIFAKTEVRGDYSDQCVRALLAYARELLNEHGYQSKTLNALLDGTLPRLDFGRYYHMVMCSIYDFDPNTPGTPPEQLSPREYRDSLLNCFPKIFCDLFPEPVQYIAPDQNLLITWEMWYGDLVKQELANIDDEEMRSILRIIYDYIQVCVSGWPIFHQCFMSRWTQYLLTREWPDNEDFYKGKWLEEKELREAFQKTNAYLAKENQEYSDALKERFITIADAARAVLRMAYSQDNVEKEADAWRKRITEGRVDLGDAIAGRQGRKFYSVAKVIRAFQKTNRETVTDGQIADAINAKAIPKNRLPQ